MRLPSIPGPGDVLALVTRSTDAVEQLLGLVPRIVRLVEAAEVVVVDIDDLLARVETTRAAADEAIARIGATQEAADDAIARIGATRAAADAAVERIEATREGADRLLDRLDAPVDRTVRLIDAFEPPLVRLQPALETLAETTHPEEVQALVRLIDHLPPVVEQLEEDVLPVLATLKTVAPDVHDLLDVMRELNQLLGKVPGMGRIKKKVDEEQAEDDD